MSDPSPTTVTMSTATSNGPDDYVPASSPEVSWRPYLIWFAHHNAYFNMRFAELEALAACCGIKREELYYCSNYSNGTVTDSDSKAQCPGDQLNPQPYTIIRLPDRIVLPSSSNRAGCQTAEEIIQFFLSRAVLIRFVCEVWAEGENHEELEMKLRRQVGAPLTGTESTTEQLQKSSDSDSSDSSSLSVPLSTIRSHLNPEKTFCFRPYSFGCSLPLQYKQILVQRFGDVLLGPKIEKSNTEKTNGTTDCTVVIDTNSEAALTAPSKRRRKSSETDIPQIDLSPDSPESQWPLVIKSVDLNDADTILLCLEDYAHSNPTGGPDREGEAAPGENIKRVFFGRLLGCGRTFKHGDKKQNERCNTNGSTTVTTKTSKESSTKSVNKTLAFYDKYQLPKRCVLGPTTMENELAFLMANVAQLTPGSISLDCFCGTGGILVALGHFCQGSNNGGLVFGNDIDTRVLKGWRVAYQKNKRGCKEILEKVRGKWYKPAEKAKTVSTEPTIGVANPDSITKEVTTVAKEVPTTTTVKSTKPGPLQFNESHPLSKDIYQNFYQYGFRRPEIILSDNSHSPWRTSNPNNSSNSISTNGNYSTDSYSSTVPWLDCIVTDPPYGIRAASKKIQTSGLSDNREVYDRSNYIPGKELYEADEILLDLLDFASLNLVDGGRLVFLLPVDLVEIKKNCLRERGEWKKEWDNVDVVMSDGNTTNDSEVQIQKEDSTSLMEGHSLKKLRNRVLPGNVTTNPSTSTGDVTVSDKPKPPMKYSAGPNGSSSTSTSKNTPIHSKTPQQILLSEKCTPCGKPWWPQCTRDKDLLDVTNYKMVPKNHPDFEVVSSTVQILSGGLGRLLVGMRRKERKGGL